MRTVVIEIEKGMLTEFRADDPTIQLLVLDRDMEQFGHDPASLRGRPGPMLPTDHETIFAIQEANPDGTGGAPEGAGLKRRYNP